MSCRTGNRHRVAVLGAGSWGTALAVLAASRVDEVCLWGRRAGQVRAMASARENRAYLPGVAFPGNLRLTDDPIDAVRGAGYVIMAVPSHGFRQVFSGIQSVLEPDALVISAAKGVENATRRTMTAVMVEEAGKEEAWRFGVLSGPSFAEEVAAGLPTAVTVAFPELPPAREVQHLLSTAWFRIYSSRDVVGVEICGAVKNIVAIGAGISDGLGYGLNARAALITRGLAEISRLGAAMGGCPQTFSGLAGLGDLVLTCTGNLSRNRTVGYNLGRGRGLDAVLGEMTMVAEGVRTTKSCYDLAGAMSIDMPILEQVYAVLYENKACAEAVRELFRRDLREEGS